MHIDLPKKLYYSIGEVAKAFHLPTTTIRYWETEFDSIKPKKNAKGDRKFTTKDIENLKLIYHLVKEKHYTFHGARIAMAHARNDLSTFELITKLEGIKAQLVDIKQQLDTPTNTPNY